MYPFIISHGPGLFHTAERESMFAVNLENLFHKHHVASMGEQVFEGQLGECYIIHDFLKKDTLIFKKPPPY
jgi:hypothetical protein